MFHESNPTLFGRPHGVLAQTEALQSTLAELRRTSGALVSDDTRAMLPARRHLASLSACLTVYFDAEEARGYFATIVEECPDLERRAIALDQGRQDLRHRVTSVRRLAFRSTDTAELGRQVEGVVEKLEKQERSERDLLEMFFREEGRAGHRRDPA